MLLRFKLDKDGFRFTNPADLITARSIDYIKCKFEIDDDGAWESADAIIAVFKSPTYNKHAEILLDSFGCCYIDPEVYKHGGTIQVKLIGDRYLNEEVISSTTVTSVLEFTINENIILPVTTPSIYSIMIADLEHSKEAVDQLIAEVAYKLAHDGFKGVGIQHISFNLDGTLTITLTDGTSFNSIYSLKGEKGDPGVYIGTEEPTDPDVSVWINPDGGPTMEPLFSLLETLFEEHPEYALQDGAVTEIKLSDDVKDKLYLDFEPCYIHIPFRSTANQGDCTIIQCGDEIVLIDFGASGDANSVINYMLNNSLTRITRCIITHFHYDHVDAYTSILGNTSLDFSDCIFYMHFPLDASQVVGNAGYLNYETDVTSYIRNMGNPIVYPSNDTTTIFNEYLSCRWLNNSPQEWEANNYYTDFTDSYGNIGTSTNMNNFSLVTEFLHISNKILLPGDLERLSQSVVAPYIDESPKLYKEEHHGVNEVANDDYIEKINPQFTIVEGTGFISHYANNAMSQHLLDNRSNVYVQAYGQKDTVFVSNGVSITCLEGTENIINDYTFTEEVIDVTAEEMDSIRETGIYRLNGIQIPAISSSNLYGFMQVSQKGSFATQDILLLSGARYTRGYSQGAWSAWAGDVYSDGTATLDTTNVTSASSNSITWRKYGHLVFVTGQVTTTSTPNGAYSSFVIATGLPLARFVQRSVTANNVASSPAVNAVLVIYTDGKLMINPRGLSCESKTFLIDFIYYV